MIVLLGFGLLHFYLLWWGDILANYALVGMVAFLFWRLPAKWLLSVALAVLAFHYAAGFVETLPMIAKVEEMLSGVTTPAEEIAEDKAEHASIPAHFEAFTESSRATEPFTSIFGYGIETLGFMLLGMAGNKARFLT